MVLNERMLRAKGLFGERVTEKTTNTSMEYRVIGSEEVVYVLVGCCARQQQARSNQSRKCTCEECLVSKCPLVAWSEGVYVGPRLLTCERNLVRCKTDNVAILLVDFTLSTYELAGEQIVHEWQS